MAAVGWIVIIAGLVGLSWLGLRWTRVRPGERRLTPLEEPGSLDPHVMRDRLRDDAMEWDDPE